MIENMALYWAMKFGNSSVSFAYLYGLVVPGGVGPRPPSRSET